MAPSSGGRWNRTVGWSLLITGFAAAVVLDPWSLSERDPAELVGSPRMAGRHAQAVVVGMAFLQIVVAEALAAGLLSSLVEWTAAWLTGVGSLVYCAGYVLLGHWPPGVWLAPVGAALNLAGFVILATAVARLPGPPHQIAILFVFCLGMLLDVGMGVAAAAPDGSWVAWLGPEDGLRLRLLRLARAAVIALSVLTLLYPAFRPLPQEKEHYLIRWAGYAMLFGAIAMPLTLVLTAFTSFHLKYLLPLPAQAVYLAALLAVILAWVRKSRLEFWGWLLVTAGISGGLLMGLYAFDGPLPDPHFVGAYNDFPRRAIRLGHAYCIVLGLACILLARERGPDYATGWLSRSAGQLLAVGSMALLGGLTFVAVLGLPVGVLAVGPALVAAALVLFRLA